MKPPVPNPPKASVFSTAIDPDTLDTAWRGIARRRVRTRRVRQAWMATPVIRGDGARRVLPRASHHTAFNSSSAPDCARKRHDAAGHVGDANC